MAPFYIQGYDKRGVVLCHTECVNEPTAHHSFIALCCGADGPLDSVKLFMVGDPDPLVFAYRGNKSMKMLITDVSVRNVIN